MPTPNDMTCVTFGSGNRHTTRHHQRETSALGTARQNRHTDSLHTASAERRHFCASQLYLGGMDLVAIQATLGHVWVSTTMNYIHVQATHIEDAWTAGQQRAADRLKGLAP